MSFKPSFVIEQARNWALAEFKNIQHGPFPYSTHLVAVAGLVSCYSRDPDVIAAAWLHDMIEAHRDQYTIADVIHMTNDRVGYLVDLLTDPLGPRSLAKQVSLGRIAGEPDAVLIKICDRFHNQATSILDRSEKYCKMYVSEFESFTERLGPGTTFEMDELLRMLLHQKWAMQKVIKEVDASPVNHHEMSSLT